MAKCQGLSLESAHDFRRLTRTLRLPLVESIATGFSQCATRAAQLAACARGLEQTLRQFRIH